MRAMEILNILSKPWVSNQDIMKIADLSASTAIKVKCAIERDFRAKYPTKFMPSHCVPTKDVIKYFDIDIEFLKGLATIRLDDANDISE